MRHRVLTSEYSMWVDPAEAFQALFRNAKNSFWLDGGVDADSGMSYLGASERVVTRAAGEHVFGFLREELSANSVSPTAVGGCASPRGCLGWVGWLGYELRGETMGTTTPHRSRYPDAALLYADRIIAFNHATGAVCLMALGDDWTGPLLAWRDATVAALDAVRPDTARRAAVRPDAARPAAGAEARWRYTDEDYLAMIDECQAAIARGDAYQLCLTTEAEVDAHPDPVLTYLALRASSPSHHGGFLRVGALALLSSTPEQFLTVSVDRVVESKPIKGTRARGTSPERDEALRKELVTSDKERAENLMIVDLMRNDLSRVCKVGSVNVPSLLAVESYAHVHQLVSTIRGRLDDDVSTVDAVMACFPAGSMTGAPKRGATEILDRLEARARGIYSGVFGYFGFDGRIDLAMVIRSIVLDAGGATVGTGGGITALSVPAEELAEVRLKAAALLAVLGVPPERRLP